MTILWQAILAWRGYMHDLKVDETYAEENHDVIGGDESICETCVAEFVDGWNVYCFNLDINDKRII